MIRSTAVLGCVAAVLALGGCAKEVDAPADKGVCWHMVPKKGGGYEFNRVRDNLPSLEYCAAALEKMRQNFVALGGSHTEIAGAYQGQFIFVQKEGIFTTSSLNTTPYLALVRSGDGRLVVPGAMPQRAP